MESIADAQPPLARGTILVFGSALIWMPNFTATMRDTGTIHYGVFSRRTFEERP